MQLQAEDRGTETMITYAQFQLDFPEFSNSVLYTASQFAFYQNFASLMLTPVWGQPAPAGQPYTMYDIGTELFIAHNLALEAVNQQAASAGAPPGTTGGPVSSKAAGPVSVSYDIAAVLAADGGWWNLTNYGTRFISLARLLGAGPTTVAPSSWGQPCNNGPAWYGPPLGYGIGGYFC
jgi:hypothetical protein